MPRQHEPLSRYPPRALAWHINDRLLVLARILPEPLAKRASALAAQAHQLASDIPENPGSAPTGDGRG